MRVSHQTCNYLATARDGNLFSGLNAIDEYGQAVLGFEQGDVVQPGLRVLPAVLAEKT